MIIIHVIFALGALALATYSNFKPRADNIKTSYGLAIGTLSSGVLLIVLNNANVLRTCLTGIFFFVIVSALNETARRKLATQEN